MKYNTASEQPTSTSILQHQQVVHFSAQLVDEDDRHGADSKYYQAEVCARSYVKFNSHKPEPGLQQPAGSLPV